MADIGVDNQRANFSTGPYGGPPLEIKISKIRLRHVLSCPKLALEPKFHEAGTFDGFGKPTQTVKIHVL